MTRIAIIEWVIFLAGIGLSAWQFRWMLRRYRRERDRQAVQRRSSRPFLLVLALGVFVLLTALTDLHIARRTAVGAIIGLDVIEWIRRRGSNEQVA